MNTHIILVVISCLWFRNNTGVYFSKHLDSFAPILVFNREVFIDSVFRHIDIVLYSTINSNRFPRTFRRLLPLEPPQPNYPIRLAFQRVHSDRF